MFSFLQKKIAIPAQSQVTACNWGKQDGWLGIGGSMGLLKVIKLQDNKPKNQQAGQLSENATLQSHTGNVNIICWNQKYRKLTTGDSNGLIIVYMRHKGQWFEQMINNRKISVVRDMRWSPDGTKIGIIYEDGHVIVGGVQGSRKWGKQFKHKLALLQWSPDSRLILFGTLDGQVVIYDENGQFIHQIRMVGLQKIVDANNFLVPKIPLASIEWFEESKMYTEQTPVGLCIGYTCGRIILMKNDKDDDPIAVDTSMTLTKIKWNPTGTILAAAGSSLQFDDKKGIVKFFDNRGNHLRNLKIPNCENVVDISWEGNGLRLAIGAGSNIYCAAIKPNYKWCYLSNGTIVFGYQKSDRIDFCIVFWNTKTDEKFMKYIKDLTEIKGQGQYCAIFSKFNQDETIQIDLCNSIGTTLQTKFVNLDVVSYTMSKTHIVIISQSYIYLWQYKSQTSRLTMFQVNTQVSLRKIGREICWFIDQKPDLNSIYDKQQFDNTKQCEDIICCAAANQNVLIIGRESGVLQRFTLPHISQQTKLFWKPLPSMIGINCDSTRLALVDIGATLNILQINSQGGNVLEFQKKQCWSIKWSEDHPLQLAFMEKSKLTTLHHLTVDPQIATDGYICCFNNLKVVYCYLDDIIKSPDENLKYDDLFMDHESSILNQFNQTYKKQGIAKAVKFAEDNNHMSLWKMIAEKSLEELDYLNAQKALLKIDDYKGLKLVKKIQTLDDREKQKAEVLAFYGKYEEAQQIYKQIQRKDLAIQMRVKIGDWFKVLQMVRQGSGYDDTLLKITDQLGNHYAQKFKWDRAAQFYLLSKNYKGLIQAFTRLEDYDNLSQIITEIPQNDPLLIDLAERFQMVGMAQYAVKCYERAGQVKAAIDCCVLLNHWNIAVQMAEKHGFGQIEGLLQQYANDLLSKNRRLEAAQLYRKANRNTQAAKLLSQIANDLIERESKPIYIKKLYVMAALQVDLYKKRLIDASMTGQNASTNKTLDSLITSDINTSSEKILNNPWRGAQAWHFYILAQKQLYAGQFRSALKTAIRLSQYQLQIDTKKIYTLVALAAYYNKSYKECSRAFVKLEGLGLLQDRQRFQQIAVSIFTRHPPKQGINEKFPCPGKNCKNQVTQYETSCKVCGSNFQACVLTGRAILIKQYYTCKSCRHKMIQSQIEKIELKFCALCHTPVDYKKLGVRNED